MPNFKVLLLDGIDPAGVDVIRRSKSIEPIVHDKISRSELLKLAGDADGIIVRSGTAVDRELMQNAKQLKKLLLNPFCLDLRCQPKNPAKC